MKINSNDNAGVDLDLVKSFVDKQEGDFTILDAATGMGLDARKLPRDVQTRLSLALRQLGCTRVEKRTHVIRFWYSPPLR